VHFFLSDERYVPGDHPDSNYRMVREALFDKVPVPATSIHIPPTDLSEPDEAALRYEEEIRDFLGRGASRLDWVLLGLGEDGHVASLFPYSPLLAETKRWVIAVRDSPKPPPLRLTMTLPLINRASQVHVLVIGKAKAGALRSALTEPRSSRRSPAQGIKPVEGTVTWWVDEEAASMLREDAAG
jgi:6-phosphogluconolactonase